ncbi:MAG: hypothetical protein LCI00_28310 [Chloroflexi bacterium]|nr:hypothetical protein [Chloroflexota bacterium]
MLNDPLKLSREGLSALTDEEFADQRKKALEAWNNKKRSGADAGHEEMLYKAFETERRRRTIRRI